MSTQPILVDGDSHVAKASGTFHAENPAPGHSGCAVVGVPAAPRQFAALDKKCVGSLTAGGRKATSPDKKFTPFQENSK